MTGKLLIDAARCNNVDRIPVWFMRQAGRYMKEYRSLREKYSFLDLCKIPDKATEVTMLPIKLLEVDAAIIFSDILLLSEFMGMELHFTDKGPVFNNPCRRESDIAALRKINFDDSFKFMHDTILNVKSQLASDIPLIGFSGAPFTLMSYCIEGRVSRDLRVVKVWMHECSDLAHRLLDILANNLIGYINFQISCGVDVIQIFDTWVGLLSSQDFKEFALPYVKKVVKGVNNKDIPIIFFSKNNGSFYNELIDIGVDVISFDWNVDISFIKSQFANRFAVQGNFDPYILYNDFSVIKLQARKLIDSMKDYRGFIFNLGHGILPDIPFDNVRYLVDVVKEYGYY